MSKKYKKIAYSFVMADLLHYGHIKLLKTARKSADYHICGLISDETCQIWQGINICNYEERKAVIESLTLVDEVIKQSSMDPTENIKTIRKKNPGSQIIVVHGDDWKTIPGREYLESIGAEIVQPEYYVQLSRDAIVKKFRQPMPHHPLKHEYFTSHFSVGNLVQFTPQKTSKLLSTKADTLKNFQSILEHSFIEKIFVCTCDDWKQYSEDILESIQTEFEEKKLIVRSSCFDEDRHDVSNAGCFESVSDIDPSKRDDLSNAIETVTLSYEKASQYNPKNQILFQNQTTDVKKSGVVFTRNLQTNAPYYLINYDDETGKTDTVTGGETSKTTLLYRNGSISDYPDKWQGLLTSIREIEAKLPGMILDIEFAEKLDGSIIIYQIRPLAANVRCENANDDLFRTMIHDCIEKYTKSTEKITNSQSFLSDMAFWNPSEIIGDNPHPLDYSIYREIITRNAWNSGLIPLGYSEVKYELMEKYGNKPYINLDYSFYSLIPDSISVETKTKLMKYYKMKLKEDLTAHDKIEFEVVFSCFDFETEGKIKELHNHDFSDDEINEISSSLKSLTLRIISNYKELLAAYEKDLNTLESETKSIIKKVENHKTFSDYIKSFFELLKVIEKFGTPQFSAVARMAFIANSLCKSLINMGHFSDDEIHSFLESIGTVASEFDIDFQKYVAGLMKKDEFIVKYGHLRAGTYDIRAKRYDQMDMSDLGAASSLSDNIIVSSGSNFKYKIDKVKLKEVLNNSLFSSIETEDFLYYISSSIEQREYFKFIFTRSLSMAIELLAHAGEELGFSRKDLSFLDLAIIKSSSFYADTYELKEAWRHWIDKNRDVHSTNSKLVFPSVIESEIDFKVITLLSARPNFIGKQRVSGEIVILETDEPVDISGKIVVLTKADPGFDWIFTKQIKGLITKYGGAASHMAIRCAEFNVPAAIGCGERTYSKIIEWDSVELDCKAGKISPYMDYNA